MACNSQTKSNTASQNATTLNEPTTNCYTYLKDSNQVSLKITVIENKVKGDLTYNYFQKDKNTGTIEGEMRGDTLFADYKFESEGLNSVREVAFLKMGNKLFEGYGEVLEKSGKMVFKNRTALNFDNKMPLIKTDCKTVIIN
ncbi:MAG: hypothetical protein EAZ15_08355 [Sphingobacteriales bacterium]|nr:MAG: hypothetical protein EAZ15_08355 [Sphingobacteriales bacterium]